MSPLFLCCSRFLKDSSVCFQSYESILTPPPPPHTALQFSWPSIQSQETASDGSLGWKGAVSDHIITSQWEMHSVENIAWTSLSVSDSYVPEFGCCESQFSDFPGWEAQHSGWVKQEPFLLASFKTSQVYFQAEGKFFCVCVCLCLSVCARAISKLHATFPCFFLKPDHLFVCCTTTTKKSMTHPHSSVLHNTRDYLWFCTFGSIQQQIDLTASCAFPPPFSQPCWLTCTYTCSSFTVEFDAFMVK